MRNWTVLLAICLIASCAPVAEPSPSGTPSPSATAAAVSATPAAAADTFTMPADQNMYEFFAEQGSLIAYSTKDTPAPYDSMLQRADPSTKTWRTVYQTDARFERMQVASGRIGLLEYREPVPSAGAFSVKVVVIDLHTGGQSTIDSYAMSAATFRGGGSAPRRPGFGLSLSAERVAWTRLIEGANGSVRGELAFAPLADPTQRTVVASSADWITPLTIDSSRLVYVLGGATQDELRVRDLVSGADTVVARAPVGNTARLGSPQMDYAVVVGRWAIWAENDPTPSPTSNAVIHALDLTTGAERTFDAGGSYCPPITVGSRYIAWICSSTGGAKSQLYDALTVQPVLTTPPGLGVGARASGDGLIWFRPPPGTREVTLFRPR